MIGVRPTWHPWLRPMLWLQLPSMRREAPDADGGRCLPFFDNGGLPFFDDDEVPIARRVSLP